MLVTLQGMNGGYAAPGGLSELATSVMNVDKSLCDGVTFDRQGWPHGKSGPASVHGELFGG